MTTNTTDAHNPGAFNDGRGGPWTPACLTCDWSAIDYRFEDFMDAHAFAKRVHTDAPGTATDRESDAQLMSRNLGPADEAES